jgi:hypothetical protein
VLNAGAGSEADCPVEATRGCDTGSGWVVASNTWRLIRAAGSEADRAKSQVASVASASARWNAHGSVELVWE